MTTYATQHQDSALADDFVGRRVLVTGGTKGIGARVASRRPRPMDAGGAARPAATRRP